MAVKVCLDAGHYGKYNRSPAVSSYYESDMTWKLHNYLKKELVAFGIGVVTTRTNQNTDRALYERGASSKGCSLFISVHSNAVGNGVNENVDYPVDIHELEAMQPPLTKSSHIRKLPWSAGASSEIEQILTIAVIPYRLIHRLTETKQTTYFHLLSISFFLYLPMIKSNL